MNGKKKCGRLLVSNHILKEKREKTKSPLYKKLCLDRHNFHRKHFKKSCIELEEAPWHLSALGKIVCLLLCEGEGEKKKKKCCYASYH